MNEMDELLQKLSGISAKGFLPSLRNGPTGVGFTLESHLGILANSSKAPDYKGIEVKVGRLSSSGSKKVRTTIFSRVPDWKSSRVKNAYDLVTQFGYVEKKRRQLYCSVSSQLNTLGLRLCVDGPTDSLHVMHQGAANAAAVQVVQWPLSTLQKALHEKHSASCFVGAQVRLRSDGTEEFHYESAVVSQGATPERFVTVIEEGHLELDFAVHLVPDSKGGLRARDHGYLFKMWEHNLHELFPSLRKVRL